MTDSRTVRIFISSTFRDFSDERDLLVRKVFPELRRRCRERQVELVDVDLRWGITEEEAHQGKVLPICLAEIDRARPFFMGLLGERFGWVPAAVLPRSRAFSGVQACGCSDAGRYRPREWQVYIRYLIGPSESGITFRHRSKRTPCH